MLFSLSDSDEHYIDKQAFDIPFVCGCRNLGEALRRIAEGAAMIRTKGEPGSGNILEAVRHMRSIVREIKQLSGLRGEELVTAAQHLKAPLELVRWVGEHGKLPASVFGPSVIQQLRGGAGEIAKKLQPAMSIRQV